MKVPSFIRLLSFVTNIARIVQIQMLRLHVIPHVALHGGHVLALHTAETDPCAQIYNLRHDQLFVAVKATRLLKCPKRPNCTNT